jgi:LPS-assembly protein
MLKLRTSARAAAATSGDLMLHGPTAPGRLRFFYGAAAFALLAGAGAGDARAQDGFLAGPAREPGGGSACQNVLCREAPPLAVTPAANANEADDGLGAEGLYLEAESLTDEAGIRTARGAVEARYQGRTVRADEVVYNVATRVVTARGNTRLINADGSVQYADEIQLDDEFSAGVALGFATRLPGAEPGQPVSKIAAASAVRRSPTLTELNRAVYTPCNLCTPEGANKEPTFSIQAERVTQNRDLRVITFRNAALRIGGVPVAYAPFFAVPDPTAERASGFLPPRVGISDRRGLSYEQPYLYVISPYSDVTITPQINTRVNPFLELTGRKRFYSGEVTARVGYTFEKDFTEEEKFGDATSRSYLLARGLFNFTPQWRWGFSAERTSDDLLFDKYGVDDVYETRGLYEPDNRRLLSQLYTVRQTERSYVSVAALSFQGLRFGDDDGRFPIVAPLVETRYEPDGPVLGGRLRVLGSAAVLQRSEGVDSRRASAEVDWRRSFTYASGVRIEPFAQARSDAYSVSDQPGAEDGSKLRGFATAGVDLSMPFFRPLRNGSVVLEPMAQLVVSNESDRDPLIPNEDSISFEFDETNLFEPNKFPGFDRFEGGIRLNAGFRATADLGSGRGGSVLIGRSFRTEEDPVFPERVGLRERASDWVVAAQINPGYGFSVFNRARLDTETLEVQRSETRFSYSGPRGYLGVGHVVDVLDVNGRRREELDFFGTAKVYRNFGVLAGGNFDLEADVSRRRGLGAYYEDECLRFEVVYETEQGDPRLGPSNSIRVRLTLATLGDTAEQGQYER